MRVIGFSTPTVWPLVVMAATAAATAKVATADSLWASKRILAPMVRAGTLPLRLLALQYGADTVYGEEIVDKRILACRRVENGRFVDFLSRPAGPQSMEQLIFRTDRARERGRCVFQMGTATPALAVRAAQVVAGDVDAIDVNMGCPKHFSISGGMGVALTQDPDRACSIIKALRDALDIPVSCKIRLRDTPSQTLDFVKALEAAGAQAIGVHARTAAERPNDPPHWDQLKALVDAVNVPIIVNGDIWGPEEAADILRITGCSSVMCARGALKNTKRCFSRLGEGGEAVAVEAADSNNSSCSSSSNISRDGHTTSNSKTSDKDTSVLDVIRDYVKVAIDCDNHGGNTKYVVQYMLKMNGLLGTDFGKSISSGKTRSLRDVAAKSGVLQYYDKVAAERAARDARQSDGSETATASTFERVAAAHEYSDDFFFARPAKRARARQEGRKVPPDFKKLLIEWGNAPAQKSRLERHQQCPQYRQVDSAAKEAKQMGTNEPAYKAAVDIGGLSFTGDWARSKKQATSKAAFEALKVLNTDAVAAWIK